ncbi:MAG: hypothetical protein HRT58_16570 [Crocinitomicaceae bacterium]|nr:hypothetical protein [Flavobacteriales bacterium]NQZ37281.1 hypothetical protein [Crocinitomicaceae bacterium]
MKRLTLVFSIATCVFFSAHSQLDVSSSADKDDWKVFVSPLSLMNPSYPAFHVGVERELGEWSAVGELGVLLPKSMYQDETSVIGFQDFSGRNKGMFLKLEGKRYLNNHFYVGANLQLLFNRTRRTDTFDGTPELTQTILSQQGIFLFCSTCVEEEYEINKVMTGLTVKLGASYDISENFYLDGYVGLGLNYHMNKHSENSELHKNPAQTDGLIGYYDAFYPGSYFYHLPVPTIGLRVGYRIP